MFSPHFPQTFNSLNRFRFEELPLPFPDSIRRVTGYNLVSTHALQQQIEASGKFTSQEDFFSRIDSDETAQSIARQMGLYLSCILLGLHHSTPANRALNPAKDDAYWDYWSQVRTVYIGGGIASGTMGEILVEEAQKFIRGYLPDYQISIAPHPRYLALIGASRYVRSGKQALVLDFGSSFIKCARATYDNTGLQSLQLLPMIPVPFDADPTPENAPAIAEKFLDVLASLHQEEDASEIPVSISAYVDETGQPRIGQRGIYMNMAHLDDDLPAYLSRKLSERLNRSVKIRLLHDGTAAASAFSPLDNAVVMTIGTAMGSGYPVERPGLCSINLSRVIVKNPS